MTVWPPPVPAGILSAAGADWPFDGPIEAFGASVAPIEEGEAGARCGDLEAEEAAAMLAVLSGIGIQTETGGVIGRDNSVAVATDAGWVGIYLSPQTPTGFPTCADEAPFLPPYVR